MEASLNRSRTVPRWLPPVLAMSAAMALLTGGAVALRPLGAPPAPPAPRSAAPATDLSTTPPALSEPPAPPGPPQTPPAPRTDPGNEVKFLDAATAARLRGMTITLPPWPDESLRRYCPAGRFRFVDGRAPTGGSEQPPGRGPWMYLVLYKGLRGIMANVDGRSGDEIVFPMGCGDIENVFRLLVVKPDGGQLRALGYVADSRHMPGHDRYFTQGGDLVVEVSSDSMSEGPEQRRRYRWQGSRFVQVGDPPRSRQPAMSTSPTCATDRS